MPQVEKSKTQTQIQQAVSPAVHEARREENPQPVQADPEQDQNMAKLLSTAKALGFANVNQYLRHLGDANEIPKKTVKHVVSFLPACVREICEGELCVCVCACLAYTVNE
jgi:hypothetical protein